MRLRNVLGMLKGEDRYDTLERWSIFFIVIGAAIFSLGMTLTVVSTRGISAIMTMFGASLSFSATAALIFIWLVKELFGG